MFTKDSKIRVFIAAELASRNAITWKFNSPDSPQFNGLWESAVRAVKGHLKRVVVEATFTYEEFSTLLTQIEAILNSRPLVPVALDDFDDIVLTPAHFLIRETVIYVHREWPSDN